MKAADLILWAAVVAVLALAVPLWAAKPKREEFAAQGIASWYGEGYRGKRMANGKPFDPEAMTCAAWDWPMGSLLRVTDVRSGQHVVVEVTDRGPARWTRCLVDLSARAFRRLAHPDVGRLAVTVTVLRVGPEAPVDLKVWGGSPRAWGAQP